MSASRTGPSATSRRERSPVVESRSSPRQIVRRVPGRRGSGLSGERRVLVLQGNVALWTLWRDDRPVAERVERLDTDATAATLCPWPVASTTGGGVRGAPDEAPVGTTSAFAKAVRHAVSSVSAIGPPTDETFVDVVVDSPLDDIERVLASASAGEAGDDRSRAPGPLARRLLARRLARHHRNAAVRLAAPRLVPLLASLLRSELTEDWCRRLEILQRDTVTVRALHSAIRLRLPSGDERRGDVLRVVRGGGAERHLLYRSGCPTFTRVVTPADGTAAAAALEETRAHLRERHGIGDVRIVGDADARSVAGDEESVTDDPVAASSAGDRRATHADGDVGPGGGGADASGVDVVDARRLAALAVAAGPCIRPGAMPASLDKWRRHVELRRLHAATALTALIAGLTVLASVVHGIDSARRRAEAMAASEALVVRFDRLASAVDARHPAPLRAEASLALVERRTATSAPDAGELLDALAAVLTAHPAIGLDRLAWSTGAGSDPSVDGALHAPSALPVRQPGDGDERRVARLEIAGRIAPSGAAPGTVPASVSGSNPEAVPESGSERGSVRERQARFEAFVDALERGAAFDELEIRLSPATAAASGGGASRSSATGTGDVDYELRLRHVGGEGER